MKSLVGLVALVTLFIYGQQSAIGQGYLDPPGIPGSAEAWVKPLNMVEPRTMIGELPFSITRPGSYYLVSNLVGKVGSHGITISASDVKLDLNGFALVGVITSAYNGIYISGSALSNITIQNGAIRGWGAYGMRADVGKGLEISGVKSFANSGDGMWMGENAMVKECMSFDNGGWGFDIGMHAVVIDCEARNNAWHGIDVEAASKVRGCTAVGNQKSGIVASSNSTITACSAIQNKEDGILVDSSCRVTDNNCVANTGGSNPAAGVHVTGSRNRIQDNNCALNDYGIKTDTAGNLVIRNSCSGNRTKDFELIFGTIFGRIEQDFSGGEIGLIGPWANFSF